MGAFCDEVFDLKFNCAFRAGTRHSRTRVLLPEPLTPVTQTNRASGIRTSRFFKLFLDAWARTSHSVFAAAAFVEPVLLPRLDSAETGRAQRVPTTGRLWPRVG